MKYNYHTHTARCHHALGTDRDYVIHAIQNGYDEIGFSDHAPYIFPSGHASNFRMELDKAQDYVDSINALKEEFKNDISIKLGFETEYYPALFKTEHKFLKSLGYDYLILGQHFTDNEYESYSRYSGSQTDSVEVLDKYISQVIEGAKTNLFTYVCHPDLINFIGDRKLYVEKMTDMVKQLKAIDIPLEFNFLGFCDKRQYPNNDFWQIVKEQGCRVVIGLDAHDPNVYDDSENLSLALQQLSDLGITPEKEIELL